MIKIMALLAALTMLSGCGQPVIGEQQVFNPNITVGESAVSEKTKQPLDTLKIAADYDSIVSSPWNCTDLSDRKAAMLLYDSPVKLNPEFKAEPSLAAVTGSGTQFTLTVADGVEFSDGSPLTAKDIDNSLTLAMAEGSFYRRRLGIITAHKAVDEKNLEITLACPVEIF